MPANPETTWSIGIYAGHSPLQLTPPEGLSNPVLTFRDVSDVPAWFVADPFMVRHENRWYMFFEVYNIDRDCGEIGLATSDDGFHWRYQHIVLREAFHLSYPYVFQWRGEYYMVPETLAREAVCLYRAERFPDRWRLVKTLLQCRAADPSLLRFDETWWLFFCPNPERHDTLALYCAGDLTGNWRQHPASPVVRHDPSRARPGGRLVVWRDEIVRYAQDSVPVYGSSVHGFTITELTRASYREEESRYNPVLTASGAGWNGLGMHTVDPHEVGPGQWIGCVDGYYGERDRKRDRREG